MPIETNIIKEVSSLLRHYLTEKLQLIYALTAKIFDTGTSFVCMPFPNSLWVKDFYSQKCTLEKLVCGISFLDELSLFSFPWKNYLKTRFPPLLCNVLHKKKCRALTWETVQLAVPNINKSDVIINL